MRPRNIEEAKQLVQRYESITVEEIKEVAGKRKFNGRKIANELTGFGDYKICILCKAVPTHIYNAFTSRKECENCLYYEFGGCVGLFMEGAEKHPKIAKKLEITFENICDAKNPQELINAFRERAKLLRELLKIGYGIEVK